MTRPMYFEGTPFENGVEQSRARANEARIKQRREAVLSKIKLVDLKLFMKESAETDAAILVMDGSTTKIQNPALKAVPEKIEILKTYWLPKSLVDYDRTGVIAADGVVEIEITMPEWLATEKGLI